MAAAGCNLVVLTATATSRRICSRTAHPGSRGRSFRRTRVAQHPAERPDQTAWRGRLVALRHMRSGHSGLPPLWRWPPSSTTEPCGRGEGILFDGDLGGAERDQLPVDGLGPASAVGRRASDPSPR